MHAPLLHPKLPVLLGLLTLAFALLVLAASAPDLGTFELSLGVGVDGPSATELGASQPAAPAAGPATPPAWVTDPLAPVQLK